MRALQCYVIFIMSFYVQKGKRKVIKGQQSMVRLCCYKVVFGMLQPTMYMEAAKPPLCEHQGPGCSSVVRSSSRVALLYILCVCERRLNW